MLLHQVSVNLLEDGRGEEFFCLLSWHQHFYPGHFLCTIGFMKWSFWKFSPWQGAEADMNVNKNHKWQENVRIAVLQNRFWEYCEGCSQAFISTGLFSELLKVPDCLLVHLKAVFLKSGPIDVGQPTHMLVFFPPPPPLMLIRNFKGFRVS